MAVECQEKVIYYTNNLSSTCGPGCRCVRQFPVFASNEAAFRRARTENCEQMEAEFAAKRAGHGLEPVRIVRAGRCLEDWADELKEERAWLRDYALMSEEDKRLAREAEEAERREQREREAEELKRSAAEEEERKKREAEEEADRERRKAR